MKWLSNWIELLAWRYVARTRRLPSPPCTYYVELAGPMVDRLGPSGKVGRYLSIAVLARDDRSGKWNESILRASTVEELNVKLRTFQQEHHQPRGWMLTFKPWTLGGSA